ncbi:MAG: CDP-diacylglycerol--glycerol-3-phosphate 3-phosphatidyltransferase [Candidatus Omnitrophica bacterium]|nr:CDP-diacylglycerol--glycerol-3-phosphate 3-phosphatidyltransferase [Candidatus Omnitrophota bacterium]
MTTLQRLLPNSLTVLRVVLTLVIMGLVFAPGVAAKAWCLGLFLVAALTDWLDGALARRWGQVTPLGILLDPIADKVLVLGLLLAFVQLEVIRAWMVLVIVLREFLITGVRLYAANRHIIIPAAREGKHKTVSQMGTLFVILVVVMVEEMAPASAARARFFTALIDGCMWVTVALTMFSGGSFFWRNRALLRNAITR